MTSTEIENGSSQQSAGETDALLQTHDEISSRLEEQRRSRLCLALALFTTLCALIGGVAIYKLHLEQPTKATEQASAQATHVLAKLNRKATNISKGCETTLILMRHCEKLGPLVQDNTGDEHCSLLGRERSHYLATLFGHEASERWPMPRHLFALTVGRRNGRNYREYETLLPLSRKANIETELVQRDEFASDFLNLLLTDDMICGHVSVISWKHEYIPELAVELGCGPHQGCPQAYDENEFDQVWQLKYVYHPARESIQGEDDLLVADTDQDKDMIEARPQDRRQLKHKHKKEHSGNAKGWNVYASVVYQNFDPLTFSKLSGDYPQGGKPSGSAWQEKTKYQSSGEL